MGLYNSRGVFDGLICGGEGVGEGWGCGGGGGGVEVIADVAYRWGNNKISHFTLAISTFLVM